MKDVVEQFYKAFQNQDAEAMSKCYHDQVEFEDPAFGKLRGVHASNMWRMLCTSQQGKDFKIDYSNIRSDGDLVVARWEAHYTFSKTGRKVHNKVKASFTFKDGKIHQHTDQFDLREWAIQALGFKGWLLGGTRFFKKQLQRQTRSLLAKFEARSSSSD